MFTSYYPNVQPYIIEERVNGKRNGEVLIHGVTNELISIMMYSNGQICYISYLQNGIRHNLHGPAHMEWYDNLQVYIISYWQNGIRHNLHGPAHMVWYDNGQINWISCCQNGFSNNLHGPAFMYWSNSKIEDIEYYHFGKLIQKYKI